MSFASPHALWLLLLVPVAVGGLVLAERRRRRASARFARPALQPNLVGDRPGSRRWVPVGLALAALGLLVVGIARPHMVRTVTREEATIVVAIDTSRSMAADDVAPNRLTAAKEALASLLEAAPDNYRVGLVSFSTSADPILLPTLDRTAAETAIRELRLGSGTALGSAIERSVALAQQRDADDPATPARGGAPPAAVVVLSDGAQTTEGITPVAAARLARRAGVPVTTVALGTRDAVVEVPLAGGLKERVAVPPDVPTLKRVAAETGGAFYEALDAERLDAVFEELGTRLARDRKRVEVTSAFAAGGIAFLLLGGALSSFWFGRAL